MTEQWKEIPGFPGYWVSNYGQVKYEHRDKPVGVHLNQQGVAYISLQKNNEQYHRALGRLVAQLFIPRERDAFDTVVNRDGVRTNCYAENLMWRPRWFAIRYHQQFDRRFESPILAPLRDMDDGEIYEGSWPVAVSFCLLEEDVVKSVEHYTVVWPTFKRFQYAD